MHSIDQVIGQYFLLGVLSKDNNCLEDLKQSIANWQRNTELIYCDTLFIVGDRLLINSIGFKADFYNFNLEFTEEVDLSTVSAGTFCGI